MALFALCGALALVLAVTISGWFRIHAVAVGLVLGAPLGAILGSIAGVSYLRVTRKRYGTT